MSNPALSGAFPEGYSVEPIAQNQQYPNSGSQRIGNNHQLFSRADPEVFVEMECHYEAFKLKFNDVKQFPYKNVYIDTNYKTVLMLSGQCFDERKNI